MHGRLDFESEGKRRQRELGLLPVFSAGLTCSSDAFHFTGLSGKKFSVNATNVALTSR